MTSDDGFSVDVFWSYRSPYCYLMLDRLLEISKNFDVSINIRPLYPMAVRNPNFFKEINPKYRKYHLRDSQRIADYYKIPYRRPIPDPIIQNMETNEIAAEQPHIRHITLLGAAAQTQGASLAFTDKVSRILWDGSVDGWDLGTHLVDAIEAAGLNGRALVADVNVDPDRFDAVISENQAAHDASDHWGAPLMIFRGETFYGQDRIDILLWRMMQAGLPVRQSLSSKP
jgi:2-hydroxychromene-2-carboxylate isomerase